MTKDQLRAQLLQQVQHYHEVEGGELKTYAAQPMPDRRPWKKRISGQTKAFLLELAETEKRQAEQPAQP